MLMWLLVRAGERGGGRPQLAAKTTVTVTDT